MTSKTRLVSHGKVSYYLLFKPCSGTVTLSVSRDQDRLNVLDTQPPAPV